VTIGPDGGHAGRRLETDAIPFRQSQDVGDALDSISVGPPVLTALEETYGIYAQPGLLGESLLR